MYYSSKKYDKKPQQLIERISPLYCLLEKLEAMQFFADIYSNVSKNQVHLITLVSYPQVATLVTLKKFQVILPEQCSGNRKCRMISGVKPHETNQNCISGKLSPEQVQVWLPEKKNYCNQQRNNQFSSKNFSSLLLKLLVLWD